MKDITIVYSRGKEPEYSFWSIFFSMIGVWVSGESIGSEGEITPQERKIEENLIVMNFIRSNDLEKCWERNEMSNNNENAFYFATRKIAVKKEVPIKIIRYDWKKKDNLYAILDCVLRESNKNEQITIRRLFGYFMEHNLWIAVWLSSELTQYGNDNFNTWIYSRVCTGIECIESQKEKKWNDRFMQLYCQYIKCKVGIENTLEQDRECARLVEQAEQLALEQRWVPQLCVLTAEICHISKRKSKFALDYYTAIPENKINSTIFLKMGNIYEQNYGDRKMAIEMYESAYNCDKNNYEAGYKIAEQTERNEDWLSAIVQYSKIVTETLDWSGSNTTQKLEYCIKSIKRMEQIATINLNLPELAEQCHKILTQIKKDIVGISGLEKQMHCMKIICKIDKKRDFIVVISDKELLDYIVKFVQQRPECNLD